MTDAELAAAARALLDRIRYLVLATTDPDGRPRVSPVYFVPRAYADLYWVSHPETHHSANLRRDPRVSAVVHDSSVVPGQGTAAYVDGTAREVPAAELAAHLPHAFDPARGGRSFTAPELTGDADLRLYVLRVERAEVHVPAGHPALGTGRDRRVAVRLSTE
jgi:nitroimidazol reductase NimA-like FMN-containing flavoprotein (pyridoxamine 5'-phosphate oxidase superfamily)